MLVLVLLLLQAASPEATAPAPAPSPTPSPTARPAPLLGRSGEPARQKTLSDHAAEMKAKGTPARPVTFDDISAGEAVPPEPGPKPAGKAASKADGDDGKAAATAAQRRMDRAVENGLAVPERTRSSRRDRARREWDQAAEACRTTPGCIPQYRDDARYGSDQPLKTDQELIEDIRKRGFSEPHPLPK
jgi:hypothetical protein